jgi:antitoxin (DNA-binding transcriptional repressor) of toxin-antitoxin stability system
MITVIIHELKQKANKLIRMVCELGEEVQITYRGEVVALLVPVKKPDTAWLKLDQLAEKIDAHWRTGESAASAVAESRR